MSSALRGSLGCNETRYRPIRDAPASSPPPPPAEDRRSRGGGAGGRGGERRLDSFAKESLRCLQPFGTISPWPFAQSQRTVALLHSRSNTPLPSPVSWHLRATNQLRARKGAVGKPAKECARRAADWLAKIFVPLLRAWPHLLPVRASAPAARQTTQSSVGTEVHKSHKRPTALTSCSRGWHTVRE